MSAVPRAGERARRSGCRRTLAGGLSAWVAAATLVAVAGAAEGDGLAVQPERAASGAHPPTLRPAAALARRSAFRPPLASLGSRPSWARKLAAARRYAGGRAGRVAFALVDERGRLLGGVRSRERHHSASVVKAMLMVAYLSKGGVRDRPLGERDRALLSPMVRRSDNATATRVHAIVGARGLRGLAARARMRDFIPDVRWGNSLITAADQARLFFRIDALVVARHRRYARTLLGSIVRRQRWGVPRAAPRGWRVLFKGGWRPHGAGRLVNQAVLVERGSTRVALAVLTDGNRSHAYGTGTVEGVARRLLRGLGSADR